MHNPEVQIMFYGKDIAQYVATTFSFNNQRQEDEKTLTFLLPSIPKISATTIG
jgi:hypothetical protein